VKVLENERRLKVTEREELHDYRRTEKAAEQSRQRKFADKVVFSKVVDRHERHSMPLTVPRSYKQRRWDAKQRVSRTKAEAEAEARRRAANDS